MKTKTYQAIRYLYYDIDVRTEDGRKVSCAFVNGTRYPSFTPGRFQTNDPQVAKALEDHRNFGVEYNLIDGKPSSFEDPAKKEVAPEDMPEMVHEVFTAQQAKEWLKENRGATNEQVKNVDAINSFCEKANVQFPDWEQK